MKHRPVAHAVRRPTALAASMLCALAAQAQAQPAPNSDDQSVEKVVVTAQKREQAAIDVPASVATVNADRLSRSGAVRLEDYAAQMPGMSVTAVSRGFSSVVLRGISTGISQPTPGTAFYIDEAPIGSITAYATGSTLTPDLDPYDLRRVEVLKGPQGTLYGAGAVGGLLRYVTQPADTQRLSGVVSIGGHKISQGGDGHEARASVNVPLMSDKLGLRISLLDRADAGYIDDPKRGLEDVNKATTRAGRIALDWKITPDWSLQTWGMSQRFRSEGLGIQDLQGPALTPTTGELQHSAAVPEKTGTDFDIFNATFKGRIGNLDLVSSTTYQKIRGDVTLDQTPLLDLLFSSTLKPLVGGSVGGRVRQIIDTKRWSQELRARSTVGDKLSYEAGLILNKEDSTNRFAQEGLLLMPSLQPLPALPGALAAFNAPLFIAQLGDHYKDYSLFGNATYSLTPQLDVTAGLRYSHVDQQYSQNYQRSLLLGTATVLDENVKNDKTTYLLSAIYKLDATTAVYGRVASGFRSGGPSALPASLASPTIGGPTFAPDTLTSYELGYKAAFAGGKGSIEAALFMTDWKDIVVQRGDNIGGATYQHFVNAGTAKVQGAEATLVLLPMPGLTLRATAAYTDSRLTANAPLANGLDGDRMPFVPKWTASLAADYRFGLAGNAAWVGGALGYIGQRRSDFSKVADALDVPSYTTLGLNAGVEIKSVRVTVYGKNLTDTRGLNHSNAIGIPSAANPMGNPIAAGTIQPRTFGIDLAYRF